MRSHARAKNKRENGVSKLLAGEEKQADIEGGRRSN